jgi:putative transposase
VRRDGRGILGGMDWHHAPLHRLDAAGAYCVTGATLHKLKIFHSRKRLDLLQETFFEFAQTYGWALHAWAFFPNHYHFVATSPDDDGTSLRRFVGDFHSAAARAINKLDGIARRQVWFQYWDTRLTFHGSYIARLRYVNENAVHHRVVQNAETYRWCSASWFRDTATSGVRNAVMNVKIDRVNVLDSF